jgi:EAL domain-containing protein (putative c-di-GMP-specific phosphodiesterase class I)
VLKLDLSLVRGIDVDHRKQELLQQVRDLTQTCRMTVVAEGVQTREEMELLMEMRIPMMQGPVLGGPEYFG